MLPRLADRAPECSHTTPISPGLLRFLNFLLRRPHAAGSSPKAGHGAHVSWPWPANHISAGPPTDGVDISDGSPSNLAADYQSPSPPVLRGVTTKSIWRPPQREHVSRSAFGGRTDLAAARSTTHQLYGRIDQKPAPPDVYLPRGSGSPGVAFEAFASHIAADSKRPPRKAA